MLIRQFKREKLNVQIYDSRTHMGQCCAGEIAKTICGQMEEKNELNMMFAAAPSQDDVLESLTAINELPWEKINAYHMDEYIGLNEAAPQGFGNFLRNRLFSKKPFKSVNYIDGSAKDTLAEAHRYARLLDGIEIDICLMGIGQNAHIAFNDPHVARFDDPVSVKRVELDEICRMQQVSDGCFAHLADVPKTALTVTIPKLMSATHIFCVVPGATKAQAVKRMLDGEITALCPSSILRSHDNARLYLDGDSAGMIDGV